MLNKKQFVTLLVGGAIVFFITFGLFFAYFYYQGIKEPLVEKESIEASVTLIDEKPSLGTIIEEAVILPTTKISLQLVDDQYRKITEKEVTSYPLVGVTKEELQRRFVDCKILQFDVNEVILQKQFISKNEVKSYSLVIQEGMLGILEKGNGSQFISLNLPEESFSSADLVLFEGQGLPISLKQKIQLQQEPYYIEQILQNYSE